MADRFRFFLGAAVCAAALDAQALSIGAARGEAVVGQPLELGFEVMLDAGAEVNASCIGADLYYGDSRVDPARVRVSSRAGSQPLQALVQVATGIAVNEPIVSVQVRAGCATPVSRRFVLLSASPVESSIATPTPTRSLPSASEMSQPVGRLAPAAVPRRPAGDAATASPARPAASRPRNPADSRAAEPRSVVEAPRAASAPAARGGARLELQSPQEWLQEQNLPLRSSDSLAPPSTTVTPEQRATAAAVWRALNGEGAAAPADAESSERVQALEAQVKNLQSAARMARGRENDLQARLGEARQDGDTAWTIAWAVAALAALCALIAGLLAWRRRKGGEEGAPGGRAAQRSRRSLNLAPLLFWKRRPKSAFGADAATVFGEGFVDTQPAPVDFSYPAEDPQVPEPLRGREAGPSLAPVADSAFAASHLPSEHPPLAPTSAEAALRAARELRSGSANELADVQQNADFFASLGQYEQAIELLQDYIASHPGTSPVAYLDLLKLFHTLSLTDPYRKLRTDFNTTFNAEVPPFASFLKTSRDLAGYADVMQRISDAWSRPQVLDVIESLLVRHTGEGAHPPFQLEAYKDLLLLYEIAKIEHSEGGGNLTAPPSAMASVPSVAAVAAASAAVAAPPPAPTPSAQAPAPAPEPMFDLSSALDFPLDLELVTGSPEKAAAPIAPQDTGLAAGLDQPLPPLLDDVSLGGGADSLSRTEPPVESNPHLIDFDMFDLAVPPASKPKP